MKQGRPSAPTWPTQGYSTPSQLGSWVYNKKKLLKKTNSSSSKRKGEDGVWREGKCIFLCLLKEGGKGNLSLVCVQLALKMGTNFKIKDNNWPFCSVWLTQRCLCLRSVCYRGKPSGDWAEQGLWVPEPALEMLFWQVVHELLWNLCYRKQLSEDTIGAALL